MNKISFYTISALMTLCGVSCSVRTHEVIADTARSGDAILLPLEKPTLCQVNDQWYMKGYKAQVRRSNLPCFQPVENQVEKEHPERYSLVSEFKNFEPRYTPISEELAKNLKEGKYRHSDAISFINSKWTATLPEGEAKGMTAKATAPAFFRNMSSHRLLRDGNNSYLLSRVGEMTADFSAIYMYPLAGLSAIVIDLPGTILLGPQSSEQPLTAQPEEAQ